MLEANELMLMQIKEIEERDEGQVLAELAGETVSEYIYEIFDKKSKKRVVKLSWIGTREVARAKGNIALSDPIITDQDGFVRIVVRATDLKRNFSVFGGCHQPKKQQVKLYDAEGKEAGYQEQDDPHYFAKALSKAQRNVIQSVIPAGFAARMIDRYLLMSGKQPLKQLEQPKGKPAYKPRLARELGEVKPEDVPNLGSMEILCYNRYHIQPTEVYRQLGYTGKADCTETPFECFVKIKSIYEEAGAEPEHTEPQETGQE